MEAPEYLDLDEIDFSDDSYSVTSLKSIPELSRRRDGAAEERPVTGVHLSGGGTLERNRGMKSSSLVHTEPLSLGSSSTQTQVHIPQFYYHV
uniref:Synphilin-1-like n=1 Tax=Gouania willdenowi TaxID=441366 RepID=A0A8C5EM94_GOUWI